MQLCVEHPRYALPCGQVKSWNFAVHRDEPCLPVIAAHTTDPCRAAVYQRGPVIRHELVQLLCLEYVLGSDALAGALSSSNASSLVMSRHQRKAKPAEQIHLAHGWPNFRAE